MPGSDEDVLRDVLSDDSERWKDTVLNAIKAAYQRRGTEPEPGQIRHQWVQTINRDDVIVACGQIISLNDTSLCDDVADVTCEECIRAVVMERMTGIPIRDTLSSDDPRITQPIEHSIGPMFTHPTVAGPVYNGGHYGGHRK